MSIERSIKDIINGTGAIMENANMDKRLDMLVRQGLMPASKLPILKRGLAKLNGGKALAPQERDSVNSLMNSFMFIVLGDDTVFNRAKTQMNKNKGMHEDNEHPLFGDPEDEFLTDEEVENLFGEDDFVYDEDLAEGTDCECENCECDPCECTVPEEDELEEGGLWDNIHAKRKRIKAGSNEKMRKPGSKGAPSAADLENSKESVQEAYKLYHKSYTDAINTAHAHHAKSGLKVSDDDRMTHIGIGSKKPGSGKTTSVNVPASHHKTGDSHTIHTQVYNKGGTHPYELNTYSSKTPKKSGPKSKNEEVEHIAEYNKPVSQMTPSEKSANNSRRKEYNDYQAKSRSVKSTDYPKGTSISATDAKKSGLSVSKDRFAKPVDAKKAAAAKLAKSRQDEFNASRTNNESYDTSPPRKTAIKWRVKPPAGTKNAHPDGMQPDKVKPMKKESVDDMANNDAPDKEKQSYKDKFDAMLKATGKTLDQMSDEEKKAFFAKVDANHDAKNESTHPQLEGFLENEARRKAAKEKGNAPGRKAPIKTAMTADPKTGKVTRSSTSDAKKAVAGGHVYAEEKMDGVADGALEGDKHQCATKIFKEGFGEGTPLLGEHSIPDADGNIAWYKTMFESGIHVVNTADSDVKILMSEGHLNHKKKSMKESAASDAAADARADSKGLAPTKQDKPDVKHDGKKDKGVEHIVPQLRKAISIGKHVTFQNGKSHEIPKGHAAKFLNKYLNGKPHEKQAMQDHAHQSHDHFKKHI